MNKLYHCDNLDAMRRLGDGSVDLVYMDPPYNSGRIYYMDEELAFDDRYISTHHYISELGARISAAHRVIADHGSVVIHVDTKMSHHVKSMCDMIFGDDHFASEIVWRYRRWPSKTPNFQRVHDVLIRYRKSMSVEPRWNQLYEPLAPSTQKTWGKGKQKAVIVDGQRVRSSTTDEESAGVPMGDVWDIGILAPTSNERTGYPTQKPMELLRRVIGALSDPGDTVLDPYAGSGTTLAVAQEMGRRWIGVDKSDAAMRIMLSRLGCEPETCATIEHHE